MAVYFIQKCACLRVPRTECRIRIKFTGHSKLWVFRMEITLSHPSGADNLEGVSGFLKQCGPLEHITEFPTRLHGSTDVDSSIY